ncbi:hypothetical protein FALCPG4_013116 [Fusarium falciforme]
MTKRPSLSECSAEKEVWEMPAPRFPGPGDVKRLKLALHKQAIAPNLKRLFRGRGIRLQYLQTATAVIRWLILRWRQYPPGKSRTAWQSVTIKSRCDYRINPFLAGTDTIH